MVLNRENRMGMKYHLMEGNNNTTIITHGYDVIKVNCSLADLSQRWYNWQIAGQSIQNAFDNLSNSEREFLMTGITSKEWDQMFDDLENFDDHSMDEKLQ